MAINEERMGYGDWAGQKGGGEPAGATAPLTKRGGVAVTRAARPTHVIVRYFGWESIPCPEKKMGNQYLAP